MLERNISFKWNEEQQAAFQKVEAILSLPQTMNLPFTVYLTFTDKSIGALLEYEVEGVVHPVNYLSRPPQGAELNYPSIKCRCFALVFSPIKLHPYPLPHSLNLVRESNPLKYLLPGLAMLGRITWWLLQLSEFDITIVTPKGLRGKICQIS